MSTFLVVFFMTFRKTAVTTGSSYGHLPIAHIALSRYKERQQRMLPLMSLPKLGRENAKESSSWMIGTSKWLIHTWTENTAFICPIKKW